MHTRTTLNYKWNSHKTNSQNYPKFQVEFTQANSQCSSREAADLGFTMKKLTGLDRLIWTRTEPPLASGQFFGLPGGVSSRTSTDLNPRQQPISFRLVAARVSLRMAPNACAATPRVPHVFQHGQDTCRTPPLLPDARLHDWNSCKATHHLTHVDQHASVACAETPRASTCQAACIASMHGDTSSFCRHSACCTVDTTF
ncbi:hypothetical protein YC2023_060665 [Brassica napus]